MIACYAIATIESCARCCHSFDIFLLQSHFLIDLSNFHQAAQSLVRKEFKLELHPLDSVVRAQSFQVRPYCIAYWIAGERHKGIASKLCVLTSTVFQGFTRKRPRYSHG